MTDKTGYPVMVDCIAQDGDGYWIWQGRTGLSYYAPAKGRIFMTSEASGVRRSFSRVLAESRRGGGVYVSQDGRIMRLAWNAGRFAMTDLGAVPGQGGVLHKLLEDEGGCLLGRHRRRLVQQRPRAVAVRLAMPGQGARLPFCCPVAGFAPCRQSGTCIILMAAAKRKNWMPIPPFPLWPWGATASCGPEQREAASMPVRQRPGGWCKRRMRGTPTAMRSRGWPRTSWGTCGSCPTNM